MAFADARFLPSGTYAIINVEHNRSISFHKEGECFSTSEVDYGCTISFLANKKWLIQGPLDVFADIGPYAEEGEDVASIKNPPKPHQWVIKRHSEEAQFYIIYSPTRPDLFWSLPNGDDGASLKFSTEHDSRASFWKFKKLEKVDGDPQPPDPMKQFVASPVKCPTQIDSAIKNTFAVTIPAGWLTTITSISCGNRVNLVRVCRIVNGALEKEDLISGWDTIDKAMTVDGSDSDSLALPSAEDAYVLVIETFNSSNRTRKDPRKLPGFKDLSTNLRVITTSRPNAMKSFPDFQTFTIFDESSEVSSPGRTQNAIITIHASVKVAVDLNDPGKPKPDTVNKGYNEDLDCPRPAHIDQWLSKYRPVFVIDDSDSMAADGAWGKVKQAVVRVTAEVMQYDSEGIDMYFLNSLLYQNSITAPADVVQIFGKIKPKGPSPIGARLEFVLNKIIDQLEQAKHDAVAYGQIKPINIVVLTNSPPSDNPTRVIRAAAGKLNEGLHHPNAIAIQFTQIGNDQLAKTALKKLSDDPSLNIVDTVTFGNKFTPENLQNSVLNAMHPSVRAKVAISSGLQFVHYRVYDDKGAIITKRPAYLNDTYLGRVRSQWVAPPHNAGSLRRCLALMERIDPNATTLFAALSSKSALADDIPVSFNANQTLGIAPDEPVAVLTKAKPGDGLRPGTENRRVPPDAQSPLTPRFLYYGVYNEDGASASKAPVDPEEHWVSRIDLDLVPPPLSVASLKQYIAANEGVVASSQLFLNKGATTALHDDDVLREDDNWPGSTSDNHMVFKFHTQADHSSSNTDWNFFIINSNYTLILGNGHNEDWDHVYVATSGVGYYGRLEDAEGPFHRSRVRNLPNLSHVKVIELRSAGPIFASSPQNLSFSRLS